MRLTRSSRRRRFAPLALATTAAAALLTGPALSATAVAAPSVAGIASADTAAVEIDPALEKAVADGGEATFFVVLKAKADLAQGRAKKDKNAKAKATYGALRSEANRTQKTLTSYLDAKKVGHEDFWITNSVLVTGDEALVEDLAKRHDVAELVQEKHYAVDVPEGENAITEDATTASLEWGITAVKADQVWSQHADRGEGVVIANVDSGVQYDHPALVGSYRGNDGNGAFTHDYNFYDATGTCTDGVPCDNNGHGTHTMGTMVGADGIGVAPGATWMAAKGCEARECSDSSLLKAGQWILAPTDSNGQNPRPELAPDIVNNSWGGGHTTFYQSTVEAWTAAGIFHTFSAGNSGNGVTCSTAEAPGSQATSYAVGAFDINGKISNFSGFGPSLVDGSMVPSIAAPGVDVRSTWPGSSYNTISGTSMAAPHVAGAAALIMAAAPSLVGDIQGVQALLNDGATDVDDTHCGGTADANNVWGEGKLNVLASVEAAPKQAGTVTGTVTDQATGAPLSGVTVDIAGTSPRTVKTGSDGGYRVHLLPGTYAFTLRGYGYATRTLADVELADDQVLTQDVSLTAVPVHAVTGTVLDVVGEPLAGVRVAVTGTPVAAVTTDAGGGFTLPEVAEGDYTLTASPAEPVLCNGAYAAKLTIDGDENTTVRLPARTDRSGHSCAPTTYAWVAGKNRVALSGDEDATTVALPFPVDFYGVTYNNVAVTTNGLLNFLSPRVGDYANDALPSNAVPNGIVAAYWDDLALDKKSTVMTAPWCSTSPTDPCGGSRTATCTSASSTSTRAAPSW
ncbi:Serine protease, subtilisin family [Nocardioides sp. YR527]|uniref:S8 family serine peptidase n=1 Tax=Nocardioides sp. YR527 TaxID=1881028 RepID=UPI00087EE6A8|nr:S8 family serine peptidase [Nocardioides sp. YR527]SDK07480.1 Serine protease, subtilisin family [Nocardioides sp. YR527]